MVVLKVDGCQFFDAYLQYWEGSPVEYFLYMKSGGATPVFSRLMLCFKSFPSSLSGLAQLVQSFWNLFNWFWAYLLLAF
jgi:hypothetical protein